MCPSEVSGAAHPGERGAGCWLEQQARHKELCSGLSSAALSAFLAPLQRGKPVCRSPEETLLQGRLLCPASMEVQISASSADLKGAPG